MYHCHTGGNHVTVGYDTVSCDSRGCCASRTTAPSPPSVSVLRYPEATKAPERLADQPPVDPRGLFDPQAELLKDRSLPPVGLRQSKAPHFSIRSSERRR